MIIFPDISQYLANPTNALILRQCLLNPFACCAAYLQIWFAIAPRDPGISSPAMVRVGLIGVEALDLNLGKYFGFQNMYCSKGWSLSYIFDSRQATATALPGATVEFHVFTEGTVKADLDGAAATWKLTGTPPAGSLNIGHWYHLVVSRNPDVRIMSLHPPRVQSYLCFKTARSRCIYVGIPTVIREGARKE